MLRAVLTSIALAAVFAVASTGDTLRVNYGDAQEITGLPPVTWVYHFAATESGVAVIEQSRAMLHILKAGSPPILVPADDDKLFFSVTAPDRPDLILTGEFNRDGSPGYTWTARDFSGRIVMGPAFTRFTMDVSPCGKYLYSVYDVGNESNKPCLFDAAGNLVHQFDCTTGSWDLRFLNDSTLLYRDGGELTVFALPQVTSVTSYSAGHLDNADLPYAAFSSDGHTYAFQSRDQIVVVDLGSGNISRLDKSSRGNFPSYPRLALSDSGKAMAVIDCSGTVEKIGVYAKKGTGYEQQKTIESQIEKGFSLAVSPPFIKEGLLLVNHSRVADSTLQFEATIYDITAEGAENGSSDVLRGFVRPSWEDKGFELITHSKSSAEITNINMRGN